MAAFALSRMRWRGQALVLTAIVATLVVPFETFALPLLRWVNKLPWLVRYNPNNYGRSWSAPPTSSSST